MDNVQLPVLEVKLLGTFSATRDGIELALPRSRKARAILAYLAMFPKGVQRDELCQLLFATAADPRGSLRWSLSRLRSALADDASAYLLASDRLRLSSLVRTDVQRLTRAVQDPQTPLEELIALDAGIDGGFLENLPLDNCPEFAAWRLALRTRYLTDHAGLLQRMIRAFSGQASAIDHARRLVSIQPHNEAAWAALVAQLRHHGDAVQARRAFEMAHKELRREGTPLTGLLREAMETNGASSLEVLAELRAPDQPNARPPATKPILCVTPCRAVDATVKTDPAAVTSAIFASATRFKGCLTVAPDLYRNGRGAVPPEQQADLLLESSMWDDEDGLRIQADLISGTSRAVLYSWHISLPRGALASVLEQITAYLSSHFEVDLTLALIKIAMDKPAKVRTSLDHYLLALPQIYTPAGYDPDATRKTLEAVVDADPGLGEALCALAWVRSTLHPFNNDAGEIRRTGSLARRSVELCPDDPLVLGWAAVVIAHADRDITLGQDLVQRALSFNPYSPMALIAASLITHYAGNDEASLELVDRAEVHGVAGPLAFLCFTVRSMCCYQQGRYQEAASWAQRALSHNPTFVIPLRIQTASLAQMGRQAEAEALRVQLTDLDPSERLGFFQRNSPYMREQAIDRLCAGLRKAGLPD